MKKIIKYFLVLIVTCIVSISCEYDENNFDMLTKDIDTNAGFFIQFYDAAQSGETGVAINGDLVEIVKTVSATLMGSPQSTDIVVDFTVDPASTLDASMYTLSATSITIPAGKTSGSIDFSTIAANMPVGEPVKFILNLAASDNTTPNVNGTILTYDLLRIEFCPLASGSSDFSGSWSNTLDINTGSTANPAWFTENGFTAVADGANSLVVSGLSVAFINGFWGEPVIAGGTFTMDVAGNGIVTIPRQYIYTTTYAGDPYDYEIAGSGTWTNCDVKPTLTFTYDIFYPGDAEGLATSYSSYLNGPALGGTFTLN
jgi:hypothetical protein